MSTNTNGEIFTQVVLEIFKVNGLLNAEGDALTKKFSLSSARWKVMGAIVKSNAALTVPQIGRTMGQSRQATQRIVDVMTKGGMLLQVDNPHHKKAKLVDLTEEGRRIYDQLDIKQFAWAAKGAENLTTNELEIALATLQKMAHHFSNQF